MALTGWPYDARKTTYVAKTKVPSDDLNSFQDQIRQSFKLKKIRLLNGVHDENQWALDSTIENGWTAAGGGVPLLLPIPFFDECTIVAVQAKVYKNAATYTLTMKLWEIDTEFDAPTTAPSKTQIGATQTVAAPGAAWQLLTLDLTGSEHEMAAEKLYVVEMGGPATSDRVAAVELHLHEYKKL